MTLDALIVPPATLPAIAALNDHRRALMPVPAADGRMALAADLLTDCGPGQTWADYGAILAGLTREMVALPEPVQP